jgi:hypothetical protein
MMASRRKPFPQAIAGCAVALLFLPLGAAGADDLGPLDYQNTIELGVNSPQATIVAPFNVTPPEHGTGQLNLIDIRAENQVWFTVNFYAHDDYSSFCASANEGKQLVRATMVTHFKLVFSPVAVETDPPSNHTEPAEYEQKFANLSTPPRDGGYMVVVEHRDRDVSRITFTLRRFGGPPIFGLPPEVFAGAIGVTVGALTALAFVARHRRRSAAHDLQKQSPEGAVGTSPPKGPP